MENKTIKIALSSILIYLISSKLYRILSQFVLWLGIEFQISNEIIHIVFYLIISAIILFFLFGLYNSYLKNKVQSIKTILVFLSISILLSLLTMLGNYLLGSYGAKHQLSYTEYLSIYGSLHSLEILFAGVYPILALLFFLWKLYKNKN